MTKGDRRETYRGKTIGRDAVNQMGTKSTSKSQCFTVTSDKKKLFDRT